MTEEEEEVEPTPTPAVPNIQLIDQALPIKELMKSEADLRKQYFVLNSEELTNLKTLCLFAKRPMSEILAVISEFYLFLTQKEVPFAIFLKTFDALVHFEQSGQLERGLGFLGSFWDVYGNLDNAYAAYEIKLREFQDVCVKYEKVCEISLEKVKEVQSLNYEIARLEKKLAELKQKFA